MVYNKRGSKNNEWGKLTDGEFDNGQNVSSRALTQMAHLRRSQMDKSKEITTTKTHTLHGVGKKAETSSL